MKKLISPFLFCGLFQSFILPAQADRIKDITSLAGIRSNQLVGYGIVVGLAGSGRWEYRDYVAIYAVACGSLWYY